ncbi:MAG: bifunctional diaminohydroxyphosphoribosylaminopyrimidine deaminase/5-amino-6-(5-phosphoribosylamino)uracil reductase RibD, partial [Glaciecola sp.]|nr:bifunctional diaminohydroxyphosphoribosylaminopyrimidine deaminase/5-amino-6-(5-phosphoribosylamino)uracil reductase RibD [Glaciecola sp.]
GIYTAAPNPMVGCVITLEGEIIGEGHHQQAGTAHAEINALIQVNSLIDNGQLVASQLNQATAYVTLEPCSHSGRTGPCADALIDAHIGRVVIAMQDPFSQVSGRGIAKLQRANIQVEVGLLAAESSALNRHFLSLVERQRPFITAKLATSLDGKIALENGISQWITGPESRQDVQAHRAQHMCILTGSQTVIADDPQLNVRLAELPANVQQILAANPLAQYTQPLRAIIDSQRLISEQYQIVRDANTLAPTHVFTPDNVALDANGKCDLSAVLDVLGQQGINSVWVEAGAGLVGAMLDARLLDELIIYQAPLILGADAKDAINIAKLTQMDQRIELDIIDTRKVGQDIKHTCHVIYPKG